MRMISRLSWFAVNPKAITIQPQYSDVGNILHYGAMGLMKDNTKRKSPLSKRSFRTPLNSTPLWKKAKASR